MIEKSEDIIRKIIVSGNVQGVFFRMATKKIANEIKIKGYVKNLKNNDVEILFIGTEDLFDKFLKKIKNNLKEYGSYGKINEIKIRKIDNFEIL